MARLCAAASPSTNRAMYALPVKRMLGLLKDLSSCGYIGFNPLLVFYLLLKKKHLSLSVFT
jgi:hypothetical protein